jgi:hypothetical protein
VKHRSLFCCSVPQDVIVPVVPVAQAEAAVQPEAAVPQVAAVQHLPQDFQELAQAPSYLWPAELSHLPLEVVQL